ncbi:unnamed protein product [Ectocarpus fasciculatus]
MGGATAIAQRGEVPERPTRIPSWLGLLKPGATIVEACPQAALGLGEGLVEALLDEFLSAPPTPAKTASESLAPTRPKCKTVVSRAMAYNILAALCRPRFVSPP